MSQTLVELEQQLTYVNEAINAILTGGQSYSRPGFSFSRASLSELRSMRTELQRQVQRMDTKEGNGVLSVVESSGGFQTEGDEWGDT